MQDGATFLFHGHTHQRLQEEKKKLADAGNFKNEKIGKNAI
jgi:hypothetical protein|tara:strand:+ start:3666 stop:3788 length:123 start_codon:yes stop_codon:yes gene_type:complete